MRWGLLWIFLTVPAHAESGVASVYQPGSHRWGGPKAANGEKINFNALTVAHYRAARTGPMVFGTCLLVRYYSRSVVVRVIDHGPHTKGRKLDFTPGVARALRFPGIGRVTFEKVACVKTETAGLQAKPPAPSRSR